MPVSGEMKNSTSHSSPSTSLWNSDPSPILWNEKIFQEWYLDIGDWQVYWHQFMPLQWFSKMHPEFDFVWNWETDARYTGNHYHFLEQVSAFAKKMPRKYLWERNQRFYIPSAYGAYKQWLNDTDASIEAGARDGKLKPVWGPQPYNATLQQPIGPKPPHSMRDDRFDWGVGEDADLITLQPIWDPTHTWWSFRDKNFQFPTRHTTSFHPERPAGREFPPPRVCQHPAAHVYQHSKQIQQKTVTLPCISRTVPAAPCKLRCGQQPLRCSTV